MLASFLGKSSPPRVKVRPIGFLFGLVAAGGQGFGALISRKGVNVAEAAGEAAHNATFGLTAAYQRILAGLLFVLIWFTLLRLMRRLPAAPTGTTPAERRARQPVDGGQRSRWPGARRGLLPMGVGDHAERHRAAHCGDRSAALHPDCLLARGRSAAPAHVLPMSSPS